MLEWLKRKTVPAPGGQSLEADEAKPLTDERLGRLLGRLGPEGRARSEPEAETAEKSAPAPGVAPMAASEPTAVVSGIALPPSPDSGPAEAPAPAPIEADSPPTDEDTAEARVTPRRADRAISQRGQGPSVAELLAKGYSFATGPDGKMVILDAEGNPTDAALTSPNAASSPAGEPASASPAPEPPLRAAVEPAVVAAPPAPEPAPVAEGKRARKPAAKALQEPEPPSRATRKRARTPAAEAVAQIDLVPESDRKPPIERVGGFTGMRVIAVASQKGGSGKTTIAAHLAVRADWVGHGPVVLIDTDPQGSLAEWWHARADETPALASVKPEDLGDNLAELRSYGTALAIIDTPPALTGSIERVIAMADLIVIPVRPSPHDLRAAGGTVELARKAGKPFLFVVNSASPRASITAQAVAALSEHGRVAPVILYQRTEYAASMIDGRTVMETAASGRSAQEIAELWQCVYAQIGLRVAA